MPYGFAMSEDRFSKLPASCQGVLISAFQTQGEIYSDQMNDITMETIKDLKATGVTFVQPDIEAYRKATAGFYTAFPEWPAGLVDEVRAAMK
jgi:TRAP-type C4-dicarboxylate transport system substrate-binding protein